MINALIEKRYAGQIGYDLRVKPRETLLLILIPLIGAVAGERLFDSFVDPDLVVHVSGFHVHHLFIGILLALPAAFWFAFGFARGKRAAALALGLGAGFILDEFVAMIATDMSQAAYRGRLSLLGAGACAGLCVALLLALTFARTKDSSY